MKIERKWSMPSRWTFTIKPIRELLEEEVGTGFLVRGLWADPFAGENSPAQETNDLNPERPTKYHLEAIEFLKQFPDNHFDGVLFDPPYSPRQVKECYDGIGLNFTAEQTKQSFYSNAKNEMTRVLKDGGKAICFGWNSMGLGKNRGFEMNRILLVAHGGSKNDTIVTVETKVSSTLNNEPQTTQETKKDNCLEKDLAAIYLHQKDIEALKLHVEKQHLPNDEQSPLKQIYVPLK